MNDKSDATRGEVTLNPMVGLRWIDKRDGTEYEVTGLSDDTISYGHTPGQGWISGGALCRTAWTERVNNGRYLIQPNTQAEGRASRTLPRLVGGTMETSHEKAD